MRKNQLPGSFSNHISFRCLHGSSKGSSFPRQRAGSTNQFFGKQRGRNCRNRIQQQRRSGRSEQRFESTHRTWSL